MVVAQKTQLGVIGGSGVYQMDGAQVILEHSIKTPYGEPSSKVIEAVVDDKRVYFLPRHGKHHEFTPSEVNYRANVYAMKTLGVTHLMAVSAVGIMKEHISPGHMVVPDQIFDRTKGIRPSTFFGDGVVGHASFADPFSEEMRQLIIKASANKKHRTHEGGSYICMEGPQFSSRAESHFYRKTLEPAVIGMTALPEAKLAREAELCYGMLALATDYDCWHEDEEDVSVEAVIKVLKQNAKRANDIVKEVAQILPPTSTSPDLDACKFAIITAREAIPQKRKKELEPLYGKYFR
jgi:5'-methylthioadenosine phosphorylase